MPAPRALVLAGVLFLPALSDIRSFDKLRANGVEDLRTNGVQAPSVSRGGPMLALAGSRVSVDGRARFLVGVSLFDALGSAEPADADLDALARWGVGLVRVWAHWREPIYAPDGSLRPEGRKRLERLTARLAERGLLLELVLLRPGQLPGQPYAAFASKEARLTAVREITQALRPYRNALFDLYNEHDHPDGPITHVEARALRDAVKAADPDRIVTISSTQFHFLTPEGALSKDGLDNLREEVKTVGVEVVAAHLPRTADWATGTAARVERLRRALETMGSPLPVYLNEERRADEDGEPLPASAYVTAAAGSKAAGAAGWVLHTGAGYGLGQRSFLRALNLQERLALERLGSIN